MKINAVVNEHKMAFLLDTESKTNLISRKFGKNKNSVLVEDNIIAKTIGRKMLNMYGVHFFDVKVDYGDNHTRYFCKSFLAAYLAENL